MEYSYEEVIEACRIITTKYTVLKNKEKQKHLRNSILLELFVDKCWNSGNPLTTLINTQLLVEEILLDITYSCLRKHLTHYIEEEL